MTDSELAQDLRERINELNRVLGIANRQGVVADLMLCELQTEEVTYAGKPFSKDPVVKMAIVATQRIWVRGFTKTLKE